VHEDIKMKNPIWGKMIQRNIKIVKEAMQKRRSRKAQTSMNKRKEYNNLPRIEIRYPMFIGRPLIGKVLLLDQALIDHLLQLLLGARSRPSGGSSSHGDELLILDHRESFLLVLFHSLLLVACYPRAASSAHVPAVVAVATAAIFQERELGFENSKIGGEYGRWKNEEEGFFTIITVKMRPT
jgi:hypothetical protein